MSTVTDSYLHSLPYYTEGSIEERGLSVANVVVTPITCAIDTIIGVGLAIASIATLGLINPLNQRAMSHAEKSEGLISKPWEFAIKAINPEADIHKNEFIRNSVCTPIHRFVTECMKSDNFLMRHVVSRLSFALLGIALVVTKLAQAIIGLPCVFLATVTIGKLERLNSLALNTLNLPVVIGVLAACILGTINPKAYD